MPTRPVLGAIAVVLHENRVLLAQRGKVPDHGLWGFPGGHVEWGETALAAAIRELGEETGITAEPVRYLTNCDVLRFGEDGLATVHYLLAAVLCRYTGGTVTPGDDAADARWFDFAEITERRLPMSQGVPEVLEEALRTLV